MLARRLTLASALLLTVPLEARAAASGDPAWPCAQRLVPELAAGQVWPGEPPLDALPEGVKLALPLQPLPPRLAGRRLPIEEAAALVEPALAGVPGAERPAQRALLFKETLAIINGERAELIAGIKRYATRQRQLADKIGADGRRLVQLRADPAQEAAVTELGDARAWDMRVFDERQRALTALCDQPVRLEQRAFALGRIIQGQPQ